MTFANEDVQNAYHTLPTELQVKLEHLEQELAELGMLLYVHLVSKGRLQIVVRVPD